MKNLRVRKRLMMLALVNTFVLSGIPSNTSYAKEDININIEFEDVRDIVIAKNEEVAIKDLPQHDSNLIGILKPGEYLKLIADTENYYEVIYNGRLAYVNADYVYISTLNDYNNFNLETIVTAKDFTDIKESIDDDSDIIGTLKEKESLKVNEELDRCYEVIYKNTLAYIDKEDVEYQKMFYKSGYATTDCGIYTNTVLNEKVSDIKKLEFIKIYDETENTYYTEVDGNYGYIDKDNVKILYDKYIVVDISDQLVEMYDNNRLSLSSSVVTGRPPKNSTPTGVYYIGDKENEISDHRYLVGPGYKSYVDYMMKFTKNIGFHDSERGIDDRGKSHGWRDFSEYGGDTYLTNGSHGCVNMPNDAAKAMYDIVYPYVVEKGNVIKVLVKE